MNDNKNIIKISDYYKDYDLPKECFNSQSLKNFPKNYYLPLSNKLMISSDSFRKWVLVESG